MKTKTRRVPITNKIAGFHYDAENHVYTLDGKPLHGVTSVLRVINKPALIQWSANEAISYVRNHPQLILIETEKGILINCTKDEYERILEEARVAHCKKKEEAGKKGTDAHSLIESVVKTAIATSDGFILSKDTGNIQVDAFIKWAKEHNVCFLASEVRLYSKTHWYAGTADLVFIMGGQKWIGDVKTGSAIYPEYYFQMAAYQNCLAEMNLHTDISGAIVINTKKYGGLEIGRNFDYEGNFKAFLAALTIHKQLEALNK